MVITNPDASVRRYGTEVAELAATSSTSEETYYPAVRDLIKSLLESRGLGVRVRVATIQERMHGGTDRPDLAVYDGAGTVLIVAGEIKKPAVEIDELARSTDRNDQIGRYLVQTGVILLCNIRSFGLLTVRRGSPRIRAVPPEDRELLEVVELWRSVRALKDRISIARDNVGALSDLLERAATEFAPIAEPEVLARVLALQARRAKAALPRRFDAVQGLLEDYGVALGLTFEGDEGLEFFRSSLIQTAFYALFAGWTLWHREDDGSRFEWERIDRYLKIPFLGKLFYEFRHPDRLEELHLAPHLDQATATLERVDREEFFTRFRVASVHDNASVAAAITYFYEPFLQAFDPLLRKELGVWYTPPEIVRYQVHKIDGVLRDELQCPRGLADDRVVVLDPCCGTGAYLIEVARCIARQLREEGEGDLLPVKILEALCRRVLGFEILTAPFVIAQLQLYMLLADLGMTPSSNDRPAVFLTNALTGWGGPEQIKLNFPELKREHEAARRVKHDARIIVILGNPPYNRFAGAAIAEEAELVDHYKGISRNNKGKQVGRSSLYTRFGVRKQLLDDLYIRFIRLAEQRIGERADFGIVSFISNSSFLTGRSHPLMRESLVKNFCTIWVDNLHGNRLASERTPWGDSCETIFSGQEAAGIKVGTAVTTLAKRRSGQRTAPSVYHRDFWGRAESKRKALLESLLIGNWSRHQKQDAASRPEGPREYDQVAPTASNRWIFSPRDIEAGFEAWPALDELFPIAFQGINPNRGLEGSIIDTDPKTLEQRMKSYYDAKDFDELRTFAPIICEPRAGYRPDVVWTTLKKTSEFSKNKILPYLLFPLDLRWIYYETTAKLLNRHRPEFWENLAANEFFVTVPEPRRAMETRPLLTTTLIDLHVHDRGSICFPRRVKAKTPVLFSTNDDNERFCNIAGCVWDVLRKHWKLSGGLEGRDAEQTTVGLFRLGVAIMHAPAYEHDHADGLAQDFAHLPVPKSRDRFMELVAAGEQVASLLDASAMPEKVLRNTLGEWRKQIGVVKCEETRQLRPEDLNVTVSYYGASQGKCRPRTYHDGETPLPYAPDGTGDLYINNTVCFSNVPEPVWRYELGGYPVLKKWLGYRHVTRRNGQALTMQEADHFRSMVQRLAALLLFHQTLDKLYEQATIDSFTAAELGIRT